LRYKHVLEKRRVCEFHKMYEPAVGTNRETANILVVTLDALLNFAASVQNYEVTCTIFPQIS
jgi:hypothetical protein